MRDCSSVGYSGVGREMVGRGKDGLVRELRSQHHSSRTFSWFYLCRAPPTQDQQQQSSDGDQYGRPASTRASHAQESWSRVAGLVRVRNAVKSSLRCHGVHKVVAGLIRGCWMVNNGLPPSSVVAELGLQLIHVRRSEAERA